MQNAQSAKKHRHFVFTLNNPTLDDPSSPKGASLNRIAALSAVSYYIVGLEKGINGTPHFQGAISFTSPHTQKSVRRLLLGCHVEVQRGTHVQAHEYCRKEGNFVEFGSPTLDKEAQASEQSAEWEAAFESAKSGDLDSIPVEKRVRYYRTWQCIKRDFQSRVLPLEDVCGHWIYGPSGTGKSHTVFSSFPGAYLKDTSKWFCGYQGEDTIWIDDIDPTQTSWIGRFLKIWADRYLFPAQVKGGSMVIRPKRVIITSNYKISDMGFATADLSAILRRYKEHEKKDIETNIII